MSPWKSTWSSKCRRPDPGFRSRRRGARKKGLNTFGWVRVKRPNPKPKDDDENRCNTPRRGRISVRIRSRSRSPSELRQPRLRERPHLLRMPDLHPESFGRVSKVRHADLPLSPPTGETSVPPSRPAGAAPPASHPPRNSSPDRFALPPSSGTPESPGPRALPLKWSPGFPDRANATAHGIRKPRPANLSSHPCRSGGFQSRESPRRAGSPAFFDSRRPRKFSAAAGIRSWRHRGRG